MKHCIGGYTPSPTKTLIGLRDEERVLKWNLEIYVDVKNEPDYPIVVDTRPFNF